MQIIPNFLVIPSNSHTFTTATCRGLEHDWVTYEQIKFTNIYNSRKTRFSTALCQSCPGLVNLADNQSRSPKFTLRPDSSFACNPAHFIEKIYFASKPRLLYASLAYSIFLTCHIYFTFYKIMLILDKFKLLILSNQPTRMYYRTNALSSP